MTARSTQQHTNTIVSAERSFDASPHGINSRSLIDHNSIRHDPNSRPMTARDRNNNSNLDVNRSLPNVKRSIPREEAIQDLIKSTGSFLDS